MNSWVGIGRLVADPEIRYASETQKAVGKFRMAIDDGYGDKKTTDFIPVVCFNKTAENVERFLSKGKMCGVSGKIKTGSYKNKEGTTVYTTEILADRVEFLSPRSEGVASEKRYDTNDPYDGFEPLGDDEDMDDDSVPF